MLCNCRGRNEGSLGGRVLRFYALMADKNHDLSEPNIVLVSGIPTKADAGFGPAKSSRPPLDLFRSPEGEGVEYHTLRELMVNWPEFIKGVFGGAAGSIVVVYALSRWLRKDSGGRRMRVR